MIDSSKLKDRHVVQWGLAYLGGAWLVIQVVDAVADPWNIPLGVQRAISVLLGFGLLVTLVVAWYHGEQGRQRVSGTELVIIGGILGIAALLVPMTLGREMEGDADPAVETGDTAALASLDRTVAVLPFDDLSPAGDHGYFADGLAEEIISMLARDGRVRVASRTSTFAMRGRPISEVGTSLAVRSVLEGSVRRDGDTVRINAQLVSVDDGFAVWSTDFTRTMEGVLRVQEEISSAVVAQLTGGPAMPSEADAIVPDAYDRYLQARFYWNRRTEADLHRAVALYTEAVALAPDYARAVSGLADTYAVMGFYQYLAPDSAFPSAQRWARRALELDPDMVEPVATIAYAELYYEWDWPAAEASFRRALALDQQYAVAHQWYGNYLVVQGRREESVEQLRIASELDPLSLIARSAYGWAYTYARAYDRAVELCDLVLEQDPNYMIAHLFRGDALLQLGDLAGAVASFERAVELSGGSSVTLAGLAHALAVVGSGEESRAILDRLVDPARTPAPPPYDVGKVLLALGRTDEAFVWFERAYRERANPLIFLAVDPEMDGVRTDARYLDLVSRLSLGD